MNLNEQAQKILELAEQKGVSHNFFFVTTFKRYQVQINILSDLETNIKKDGAIVTKEYVKGRGNVYTHPAIAEYSRVSSAANNTVGTLIKIVQSMKSDEEPNNEKNELINFLMGK